MKRNANGFTLIEIAIVLVIIGLLLGGVLKGQELITGARVRNLISQQDGIKAAFFGFQDRYRALPGDYAAANANIANVCATCNGNGNGRIETAATPPSGVTIFAQEQILAWNHLTSAGFLNGSYAASGTTPSDSNNAKNPYSTYLQIVYDGIYGIGVAATPSAAKHNLKTGTQVPVEIIAEVDRKVDDGNPLTGGFQFSLYDGGTGTAPILNGAGGCLTAATAPAAWAISGGTTNCGGASLF
jgi:prepilin-type N-terminal cleavage/methylation domain-containing protein